MLKDKNITLSQRIYQDQVDMDELRGELHFLTIKQAFTEAELALSKRAEEQVLHQKALKLELSGEKIKNLNTQLLMERNRSKFNRISRRQKSTHETCGLEDLAFTVKFFIND
ncbi:uncharacterized protein LOC144771653 isoform X1 [Lissotriton helveticus]